ncbi:hypothetical protein KY289_035844 [Solanum tuberosum]|nr:hypothetical protein KY289_035844 [Solanum tuberosum]
MTREERITAMENQKVLNGKVFDPDILTKFGISNLFDALATKNGDVKNAGLSKRFLKGKYQLFFEFINKVASAADLFLMEKLDELEEINLSAIMLELTDLTEILNNKEIEIASLRSELEKVVSRGPGTSDAKVEE